MPTGTVKKFAKKYHTTVDTAESEWSDAKSTISKTYDKDNKKYWGTVMNVFKSKMKKHHGKKSKKNENIIVKFDDFNLNESEIYFDSDFTTIIKDIDIGVNYIESHPYFNGLSEGNDIEYECTLSVYWSLEPDMRNYGIKTMGLSINGIKGIISWSVDEEFIEEKDKELLSQHGKLFANDKIEGEIIIDSDEDWTIESDVEFEKDGAVSPCEVEINFKTKKFIVK